jgi:nucleoside-diphosphate-sugar epimerase
MSNVLITGSSGFVGKNLISYLNQKKVDIIPFSRSKGCDYSLIDDQFLDNQQIEAIIHLAGKAHDLRKVVNSTDYYQANTELTKQIFDAFKRSNATTFIYISSVKALADSTDIPLAEEMMPSPLTDYGKSKLAAEEYLQNEILSAKKRVYILRPCMIHGPGNKGNLNLLYQMVKKGIPYPLGAFNNTRSFLSVENLCFVIHQLLYRANIVSGIYHISDDKPVSTNELVKLMANCLGKRGKLWKISPNLIRWIARIGDLIPLPINSERLQKLTESYVVSNQKLLSVLQVTLPVNAKDGLIKTIESFNKDIYY